MHPDAEYRGTHQGEITQVLAGPGGQTAGERLDALDAKLLEVRTLTAAFTEKFASADETTQSQYISRMKADGELAAMRWLVNGK